LIDFIRAIIYLQPLFWIFLLRFQNEDLEYYFNKVLNVLVILFYVVFIGFVLNFNMSYAFYNEKLLLIYSTMLLVSYYTLTLYFSNKESLCLSFLIVYMNSFYWEFPLHTIALLHGEIINTIVQIFTHVYFIPILLMYVKFNDNRKAIKSLLYGLVVLTIFTTILGFQYPFRVFMIRVFDIRLPRPRHIQIIMRLSGLFFILKTFILHSKIDIFDEHEKTNRIV